jgi:hypothetical protein
VLPVGLEEPPNGPIQDAQVERTQCRVESLQIQRSKARRRGDQLLETANQAQLAKTVHQRPLGPRHFERGVEVRHLPNPEIGCSLPHERGGMWVDLDSRRTQNERSPATSRQQRHHVPVRVTRTQKRESGVVGKHSVRAQYGARQVRVGRNQLRIVARSDRRVEPALDAHDPAGGPEVLQALQQGGRWPPLAVRFGEHRAAEHRVAIEKRLGGCAADLTLCAHTT